METIHIIMIIVGVALLMSLISVVRTKRRRTTEINLKPELIIRTLGENNIQSIDYIRSKLVAKLKDINQADMNALKATGAVGINIVGDTVKWYYPNSNEAIAKALKKMIDTKKD